MCARRWPRSNWARPTPPWSTARTAQSAAGGANGVGRLAIPDQYNVVARYYIAVLKGARRPDGRRGTSWPTPFPRPARPRSRVRLLPPPPPPCLDRAARPPGPRARLRHRPGLLSTVPVWRCCCAWRPPISCAVPRDPTALDAMRLSLAQHALQPGPHARLRHAAGLCAGARRFPGKRLVETVVELPIVLPPRRGRAWRSLFTFGRRGLLGPPLSALGLDIAFAFPAVVLAQTFVASPFYINAARLSFAAVPDGIPGGGRHRGRRRGAGLPPHLRAAGAARAS